MTTEKLWTIDDIRDAMTANGSHWWDKGTMRFFRCRVNSEVYQGPGGVCFVSSEQYDDSSPRLYTVRKFDPVTLGISEVGEFQGFKSRSGAHDAARRAAGVAKPTANKAPRKITDAQQLLIDLHRNGCPNATDDAVFVLIARAEDHQQVMTEYCNGECEPFDADGEPLAHLRGIREALERVASAIGCGVVLSGDPRGCTVKLTLPTGATNDWGASGWCIPMRRF